MERKNWTALIFGVAIVVSAAILGKAHLERNRPSSSISVTGLGSKNFTSDLIVWEGSFLAEDKELGKAYTALESDKSTIKNYLISKGIVDSSIVFSAVSTRENTKSIYSADGRYIGDEFLGYQLTQSVEIESREVDQIEKVAREITELLNQGVQFYSQPPRYYFTGLTALKIEMISQATEDARSRAERIASNAGASLGGLVTAQMGIFQITGQHSDENYSWGGTFNTEDKHKTASITMKLVYRVD